MLQIDVVMSEDFDETSQEFLTETRALTLEHSLVSLSKWESKYEKPFLSETEKTVDEIMDYITMMDLSPETPPEVYANITNEQYLDINKHINAKRTATWFNELETKKKSTQVVTSELIYYWLTSYEIPWEAQHWHLSRLFTLIKVFGAERSQHDTTNKKSRTSAESIAAKRRKLNEERRKQLGTSG